MMAAADDLICHVCSEGHNSQNSPTKAQKAGVDAPGPRRLIAWAVGPDPHGPCESLSYVAE
uniref:Uncharacterized protein n=1 Tax=Physcomitrium patens TaxID=3218 RepID=A0A2K1JXD6_PHYPA|nr:hypothetical protein PHYPA_013278 [Physcomitrium patens]